MQDTEKAFCIFCRREIPAFATICSNCGRRLHAMKLAGPKIETDFYKIVPDGKQFAILVGGEVALSGLDATDLAEATNAVSILNRFIEGERLESNR